MFRTALVAAVLLISCQSQLSAQTPSAADDLRNWRILGLPITADWNCVGYNFQYHVDQVRSGHRYLPSVRFPASSLTANNANATSAAMKLTDDAWNFVRTEKLPLGLRTDNISGAFILPAYTVPIQLSNIPNSPLVWMQRGNTLATMQMVDTLGPTSLWAKEGGLWGSSVMMKNLQTLHPEPTYVVFVENNEGPDEPLNRYKAPVVNGVDPDTFLSQAQLQTLSLRMRDRVAQLRQTDPNPKVSSYQLEYWNHRRDQYRALYDAFESKLVPLWKGKTLTAGYRGQDKPYGGWGNAPFFNELGYAPELTYRDAGSSPLYFDGTRMYDFTSLDVAEVLNLIPNWEDARARNPKAYREVSVFINDRGVGKAKLAGIHEPITPARWEGYVQWLLWSIHDPGVPVLLRRYQNSSVTPTTKFFPAEDFAALDSWGLSSLKTATDETYRTPLINAVDRVSTNPTLRDFWLRGKPIVVPGLGHPVKQEHPNNGYPVAGKPDNRWRFLECSLNKPRQNWQVVSGKVTEKINVWAVGTRIDDQVLLFAWSPMNLTGNMSVTVPELGTFTVATPQPWGYWILKAGAVPQPLTVN